MSWQRTIPGTKVLRLEFLQTLIRVAEDPLTATTFFRAPKIKQIADYGVLSPSQIASVTGCPVSTVKNILYALRIEPIRRRGKLLPEILGMLASCVRRYERGVSLDPAVVEVLVESTTASLLELLVGIPRSSYYRTKDRLDETRSLL